jgi:hypothetical protein
MFQSTDKRELERSTRARSVHFDEDEDEQAAEAPSEDAPLSPIMTPKQEVQEVEAALAAEAPPAPLPVAEEPQSTDVNTGAAAPSAKAASTGRRKSSDASAKRLESGPVPPAAQALAEMDAAEPVSVVPKRLPQMQSTLGPHTRSPRFNKHLPPPPIPPLLHPAPAPADEEQQAPAPKPETAADDSMASAQAPDVDAADEAIGASSSPPPRPDAAALDEAKSVVMDSVEDEAAALSEPSSAQLADDLPQDPDVPSIYPALHSSPKATAAREQASVAAAEPAPSVAEAPMPAILSHDETDAASSLYPSLPSLQSEQNVAGPSSPRAAPGSLPKSPSVSSDEDEILVPRRSTSQEAPEPVARPQQPAAPRRTASAEKRRRSSAGSFAADLVGRAAAAVGEAISDAVQAAGGEADVEAVPAAATSFEASALDSGSDEAEEELVEDQSEEDEKPSDEEEDDDEILLIETQPSHLVQGISGLEEEEEPFAPALEENEDVGDVASAEDEDEEESESGDSGDDDGEGVALDDASVGSESAASGSSEVLDESESTPAQQLNGHDASTSRSLSPSSSSAALTDQENVLMPLPRSPGAAAADVEHPIDLTGDSDSEEQSTDALTDRALEVLRSTSPRKVLAALPAPRVPRPSSGILSSGPLARASLSGAAQLNGSLARSPSAISSVSAIGASALRHSRRSLSHTFAARAAAKTQKRKREPIFMWDHKVKTQAANEQKKRATLAGMRRRVMDATGHDIHSLDAVVSYRTEVERKSKTNGVIVSSFDSELTILRDLLARREKSVSQNALRQSRTHLKEAERLAAEDAERKRRARGILGRQPVSSTCIVSAQCLTPSCSCPRLSRPSSRQSCSRRSATAASRRPSPARRRRTATSSACSRASGSTTRSSTSTWCSSTRATPTCCSGAPRRRCRCRTPLPTPTATRSRRPSSPRGGRARRTATGTCTPSSRACTRASRS